MNILSMNFYNYLVTKRYLNNTPYILTKLQTSNISKQEKTCLIKDIN